MLIFISSKKPMVQLHPTVIELAGLKMLDKLQNRLGYHFKDIKLLERALDRRSYTAKNGKKTNHFEHLEFLGDRALNLCIATILAQLHPEWTPNQLQGVYVHYTRNTDNSSKNGGPLYRIAKDLDIESNLILEKGESLNATGNRGKSTKKNVKTREGALSDHMEAIISAIYLDTNYDLQMLIPIVSRLFKPLGLLDTDHISVSNFGESQLDEDEPIVEQFIKVVSTGNLNDLMKLDPAGINAKTAAYGLLVASTNQRSNIVPYLVRHYKIDLQTISDELNDPNLSVSIRRFLNNFLIENYLEINKKNLLSDTDKDTLFLLLSQQGNMKKLMDANLTVTSEIATEGLLLAIQENKNNMMIYIIKKYPVKTSVLQNTLDNPSTDADIKNFLTKQIRLKTGEQSPLNIKINTNDEAKNVVSEHDFQVIQTQDVTVISVVDNTHEFAAETTHAINRLGFFNEFSQIKSDPDLVDRNIHNNVNKKDGDSGLCCIIN